jgi:hypothetical protein
LDVKEENMRKSEKNGETINLLREEQERESEAISTEKQEPLDSFRSYSKVIET